MGRPAKYAHGWPSVTEIAGFANGFNPTWWYKAKRNELAKDSNNLCECGHLIPDPMAVCDQIKRDSQQIGHKVHKGIELFLKGKKFDEASEGMTNDQQVMLSYLTDWCSKTKIRVIAMEEVLYSEKYEYGGTPDAVATFDDGKTLSLVDWKTDSTPKGKAQEREREAKYAWQLAGYAIAYEETKKVKINKGVMVRASKDLKFNVVELPSLTQAKKDFKMLRDIYRRVKGK